jgi:DNA-binding response OmpR family regulator
LAGAAQDGPVHLEVGCVSLDAISGVVQLCGRQIRLTAAEARLLEALMQNAGRAVSRAHLTEYALGHRLSPSERGIERAGT